jgi:hypothetical protein
MNTSAMRPGSVPVKPFGPTPIISYRCGARRHVIARTDEAAERRLQTESRKDVSGNELADEPFRVASLVEPDFLGRRHADDHCVRVTFEERGVLPEGRIVEVVLVVGSVLRVDERPGDEEEAIGVGHRQRPEQHAVDEAERGGRGADGQAERQHGGGGRNTVAAQLAPAEDDVGEQGVEEGEAALIAQRVHGLGGAAGSNSRRAHRLVRAIAPAARVLRRQLQVELELLLQLAVARVPAERSPEAVHHLAKYAHHSLRGFTPRRQAACA